MAAYDKSVATSSFTTDSSSDSSVSDGWQELTKSDYAKVIFSDLLCNATSGTVECKFQITDNVHEDPNDYVGLFRIGYDDLSQCLVSKMLSQTKCEDDGKLQRCVFSANELPHLEDSFYQFLYVTRDQEVCGASMPFEIKMSAVEAKEISSEGSASEKVEGGFLLVSNEMENKVKEQPTEQEIVPHGITSALSEQKKKEIAAWVSQNPAQNPDYHSLYEQSYAEHSYSIAALQESKDLAVKEVTRLRGFLESQNIEVLDLKIRLAASEEKAKLSQSLLDEQNIELVQLKNKLAESEEKFKLSIGLIEQQNIKLLQLKSRLAESEEKLKASLSRIDRYQTRYNDLMEELQLKENESYKDECRISDLKRELHLKEQEIQQATAKFGTHSIENVLQKAQDFVRIVSDTIEKLDFTDEEELEKFFKLKIQLLIITSKMARATDMAKVCDRNGLDKTIQSTVETDKKGNSCADCSGLQPPSCTVEIEEPLSKNSNADASKVEELDSLSSSAPETASVSNSPSNEATPKKVEQRIPLMKVFVSESLEHQVVELPRLDVIDQNTAAILQTDRPLDIEDINVINRLTEKIIKRGSNLYEAIELVDDSSSESGSDISETSETSSSIKKDLLSVGRVLSMLSNLSNQTTLEELILVQSEEDIDLISKNEWNVLIQKCALHYQIEILLEHIEKQKEGMKKVTERICELLTQCMLLKDEKLLLDDCVEQLERIVVKKDAQFENFTRDLEFKNDLLRRVCSERDELLSRAELAERAVEDYRARLVEASNIYKQQFVKIEKMSKKLQKCKLAKDKVRFSKASKGESCSTSSESSRTMSSFEVVPMNWVQNVNDSDTGEHMFEKASSVSKENEQDSKASLVAPSYNPLKSGGDLLPSIHEDTMASLDLQKSEAVDSKSLEAASVFSDFASYEHFQRVIKEHFSDMKTPAASKNSPECFISCYVCGEIFPLGPEDPVALVNHLENEHSMKMCPVCGQLFEDAVPQKYFSIHVDKHF